MNEDPNRDTITLAYIVTSQIEKVEERTRLRCRPEETLVYIRKGTSIPRFKKSFVFDKPSIVDCNSCIDFSRSEFEAAMRQSVSTYRGQLGVDMLERLKKGANMSPVLTDATKSAMGALNLKPSPRVASRFKTTIRVSPLPDSKA